MEDALKKVDSLSNTQPYDTVNPTVRSNPDKKRNGFSNALKEKMKEKLNGEAHHDDEVILENKEEKEDEPKHNQTQSANQPGEDVDTVNNDEKNNEDDNLLEHVDLKV